MTSRGARASYLEESYLVMEKEIQGINSVVIDQEIYFFWPLPDGLTSALFILGFLWQGCFMEFKKFLFSMKF